MTNHQFRSLDTILSAHGLDIASMETVKAPAVLVARLYGTDAQEARSLMHAHETPDHLFLRLLLFYQHAQRQDSDTALLKAYERVEREAR